jgi:Fe-S cluster biogenesis protein NfuA
MSVLKRGPKPEAVEARIRDVIAALRPLLHIEPASGCIELVRFDAVSGVARVKVSGGCPDCDMTATALITGIEAHLMQRVPEIRAVEAEPEP